MVQYMEKIIIAIIVITVIGYLVSKIMFAADFAYEQLHQSPTVASQQARTRLDPVTVRSRQQDPEIQQDSPLGTYKGRKK